MSAVATAIIAATVISTGVSIYQGQQQKKAQEASLQQQRDAQAQAEQAALKQEKVSEEATNKAQAKRPDAGAILSQAEQAAKVGGGSTMLTGSQGVDPNSLQLEKKTLLGA